MKGEPDMEKEYTRVELVIISVLSAMIAFIGGHVVGTHAANDVRREAVKAGAARYAPGPDGESKFEWNAPAEKKP
jgi:hypothetical protein